MILKFKIDSDFIDNLKLAPSANSVTPWPAFQKEITTITPFKYPINIIKNYSAPFRSITKLIGVKTLHARILGIAVTLCTSTLCATWDILNVMILNKL